MGAPDVPGSIAGAPTRAPSMGGSRNFHLDAMRGLAALVVVFDHMSSQFFVPYRQAGHGLLVNLIYSNHYFARAAVLLFFVLSGYLVGTSVLKANQRGRWSWRSYLLSRFTRLYLVLIPALLLTLLLDLAGRHIPFTASYYLAPQAGNPISFAQMDTVGSFFGTLFFVQIIFTNLFGSDGAAWSLAFEFWYYILFPVAVLCFYRRRSYLLYAALFIILAVFVGRDIFALFPAWLAGVMVGVLADRYPLRSTFGRRATFLLGATLMLGVIVLSAAHRLGGVPADYGLALTATLMIWAALCSTPASTAYARFAIFFSELSYTLYLTHQPLLTMLAAVWLHRRPWPPNLTHFILGIIPMTLCLAFAYLFYILFESRTDVVRNTLKRRLPG